jgi:Tfp pilus assembly protein PilO
LGLAALFLYVCSTEIKDRLAEVIASYGELQQKKSEFLKPEQIAERKLYLMSQVKALTEALSNGDQSYAQTPTGVVEFLSACARKCNLQFESFAPSAIKSDGEIRDLGFKIHTSGNYHQIGHFVNEMESGTLTIRVKKLEITNHSVGKSTIHLDLEGSAFIAKK